MAGKIADGRALKKGEKQKEEVRAGKSLRGGMISFLYGGDVCMKTGVAHGDGFCWAKC